VRSLAALRLGNVALLLLASFVHAQTQCACDAKNPETLKARECSLCAEAEKQPAGTVIFFLPDANPRKPNRLLAIPREHAPALHRVVDLTPESRAALWREAIDKAKSTWGEDWAIAYNGDRVRTQCHVHVHIGKIIPGVEWGDFLLVNSPAEIPVPGVDGYWIHPVAGGKLHVHTGEQVTETVLLR
jgi:diadenosine tetraphosphate (Ap4A) HIT family hydrolase